MNRCNYATKLHRKVWSLDMAGCELLDIIIKPLINVIMDKLKIYQKHMINMFNKLKNNKMQKEMYDAFMNESKKYSLPLNSLMIELEDDNTMDENKTKLTKIVVKELCSKVRYKSTKYLEHKII